LPFASRLLRWHRETTSENEYLPVAAVQMFFFNRRHATPLAFARFANFVFTPNERFHSAQRTFIERLESIRYGESDLYRDIGRRLLARVVGSGIYPEDVTRDAALALARDLPARGSQARHEVQSLIGYLHDQRVPAAGKVALYRALLAKSTEESSQTVLRQTLAGDVYAAIVDGGYYGSVKAQAIESVLLEPLRKGAVVSTLSDIQRWQEAFVWMTEQSKNTLASYLLRHPERIADAENLVHHPRITTLVSEVPESQGRLFTFIFADENRLNAFIAQINGATTTQEELRRAVMGVASREFLRDGTNQWRAIINLQDRSAGVMVGETFNTPHATIVQSLGGNTADYLAVIKEGNRIGIDRVDNRVMSREERMEQARYGVGVLLAEGADPSYRFFFRDASGLETDYTLAEVASGRLSDIVNPYAVIPEDFRFAQLRFGLEQPTDRVAGNIYFERRRNALDIEIPNGAFQREGELAAMLLRQGYNPDTRLTIRKGIGEEVVQTDSLGNIGGISSNFSFEVGDLFEGDVEGGRENLLLRFLDDGRAELARLNGQVLVYTRDEFTTRLRNGLLKFIVPRPDLRYSAVRPVGRPSAILRRVLALGRIELVGESRSGFIGLFKNDGSFIWTQDTQAHNQLLRAVGVVEPEVAIKVTYDANTRTWTGGGSLESIRTFIGFIQSQQLPLPGYFDLTVFDNSTLNYRGSFEEMMRQRPEFFIQPEQESVDVQGEEPNQSIAQELDNCRPQASLFVNSVYAVGDGGARRN
ncbi:hypothetical protein HY411_02185, partial [Candidatus Gottesmanbacteria bacterium]|nr:hypothetical protein [Candidatus Gottesmanbacteria bacterium]